MYVLFDKFSLYSQSQKKNNFLALADNVMADNKNQDVAYFLSFCIEQYKNEKGLSGYAAFALYEGGLIDKQTLIAELKAYRLVDQYLFHTDRSLLYVRFKGAYEVTL